MNTSASHIDGREISVLKRISVCEGTVWNNFHQMHWAISEGMVSLFQLQPKSAIVAILIAAKWSMGNDVEVSLQSYE